MKSILNYFGKKKRLKKIAEHYDVETPKWRPIMGEVLNASRPENLDELLAYLMRESGMKDGMKIIDCGCGICGPAVYYATQLDVEITSITISEVQYKIAKEKIAAAKLKGKINLVLADYNRAGEMFPPASFDLAYFAEAFCYAENPIDMLNTIYKLLKPGGILYMKDFFLVDDLKKENEALYNKIRIKINEFYATNLVDEYNDIESFKKILHGSPFEVLFIRKPLYKTDQYNLYKVYQGMGDLGSDDANDVIRVFDFYEAKAMKTIADLPRKAGQIGSRIAD
jgi:cyclopropane fatty-acyl-phospholipid synthase-like methyltransferase